MAKTNKSFIKRIRVTKNGKVLKRASGQNHFNAKARRVKQLNKKGLEIFREGDKAVRTYLPYSHIKFN